MWMQADITGAEAGRAWQFWFRLSVWRKLPTTWFRSVLRIACWLALVLAAPVGSCSQARLEVIQLESRALKDNPLHDPASRLVPVFLPVQATNGARLPVVYYLPGFGNDSAGFIRDSNAWLRFTQKVADEVTPVVIVMVDGKTRWGGSQFLNSAAQGNYEDYVCDEIVRAVESRHPVPESGIKRIIAGHSSGGFGALRLGMAHQHLFEAVIAMSPDSDFPTSHLPLVTVPGVAKVPLLKIRAIAAEKLPVPEDGDLDYALALSAAYAPRGFPHAGEFEWLYDGKGQFRQDVWLRWLDNDPLTLVRRNPHAFSKDQAIYLEGAARDEFSANIGAREIFEVLSHQGMHCSFYEPPGHHTDHVPERLQRGLEWVFGRPLSEIK
jgi:S-formylglutathione hydrolase FrmB